MMMKWEAFLTLLGMMTGIKRSTKRPYRIALIRELIKKRNLKNAKEILLNTLFIRISYADHSQDIMMDRMPLSDEERESLKALLVLILPKSMVCQKRYEPDSELTHQCTYRFIKQ